MVCSKAGHKMITHTGCEAVCSKVCTSGTRRNITVIRFLGYKYQFRTKGNSYSYVKERITSIYVCVSKLVSETVVMCALQWIFHPGRGRILRGPSLEIVGDIGRLLHSNVCWHIDHWSKLHFTVMNATFRISHDWYTVVLLVTGYVQVNYIGM